MTLLYQKIFGKSTHHRDLFIDFFKKISYNIYKDKDKKEKMMIMYIISFIVGVIIGVFLEAFMFSIGLNDKENEIYSEGYTNGYNKCKEEENE